MKKLNQYINEKLILNKKINNDDTIISIEKPENLNGFSYRGKNFPWLKSQNNNEPTGLISCTFSEMKQIMGFEPEPVEPHPDKSFYEWWAEINGIQFHIYDWKVADDWDFFDDEDNDVDWHIATRSTEDLIAVENFLKERIKSILG